ncbi:MAG: hypothetical protein DMF70_07480 [Acidobacteria bacterium]|nr:MAG: hypothetical protein DMF70_07480 [Acidobacteriota bacterium]
MLSNEVRSGIGSGGTGFNNHRWRELVFLISLVGDLKQRSSHERTTVLSEYDAFIDWIARVPQEGQRQFRHMLRFFCFPDRVERMSSNRERRAVIAGFHVAPERETKNWSDRRLDDALLKLRDTLQKAHPSDILDFYEQPLRDQWHRPKKEPDDNAPETPTTNPKLSFSAEDCAVFGRYPNSVSWKDVPKADQELFKDVWTKLKALSQELARSPAAPIPLQADTSHYVPNGRSPNEIWSCVYPAAVSNKSYGLQVALIISERGAEVCFCEGSGTSQVTDLAKKRELEAYFEMMRKRLGNVPREVIAAVEAAMKRRWCYRKSWLTTPNATEFSSLTEWLKYASSPEGSAASVSLYFKPEELEALGTGIFNTFAETLDTFGPILKAVYLGAAVPRQMTDRDAARVDFSLFTQVDDVISGCGLRTPPNFLRRLIASLAAKPFVILTGTSGTGKTRIAQAIALWLTSDRQAYQLIPVGADWTGNDNIVGYPDGLDPTVYVGKPALELIWHAAENPDLPHFLILDEMNLSHVERYFADLLSATESHEHIPLYSGAARKLSGRELPRNLAVPPNLFVVGTVNVDETTYMFSPKVLDRANVLEFRIEANDIRNYFGGNNTPNLSQITGQGAVLGATLVRAATQQVDTPSDVRDRFESEMLLFFNALKPHGVEFGYRVAHEAARFLCFYHELSPNDTSWFDKAFDAVVVQKSLPKLHGQRARLAPLLRKLWFLTVNNENTRGTDVLKRLDDVARSTERTAEPSVVPTGSPYPISAEKIARMWRLLNENGFASFAEA